MFHRHFLVAPSFARLIRKERGLASRIVEGYLLSRPDRDQFVSIEQDHSFLVLATTAQGDRAEERTEVPRSQAEALLEICAGRVGYERIRLAVPGAGQASLDHFVAPGALNLLQIGFATREEAQSFVAPAWAGPEVTAEEAFRTGSLALDGMPEREVAVSDAALNALLDFVEDRQGFGRSGAEARDGVPVQERAYALPRTDGQIESVLASVAEALEGHVPAAAESEPDSSVILTIDRVEGRGRRA